MTAGQAVQGVWLLLWLVLMLRAWATLRRLMAHTERVDAGVEDRDPVGARLVGQAQRRAWAAIGWAMLLAGLGPLLR